MFAWIEGALALAQDRQFVYNDIICSQTLDCDLMCNQIAFRSNAKENSIRIQKKNAIPMRLLCCGVRAHTHKHTHKHAVWMRKNSRKLNLIFAVCKHHSKKYADNITTNASCRLEWEAVRKLRLQIKCANSASEFSSE